MNRSVATALPAQRRGTLSVILVGAAVALSLFGDVALYAILPIHYQALGLSPIQVGLILSMNRTVRLLTNTFARHVLGRRKTVMFFLGALATGSAIAFSYSLVPIFPVLLILRAVWGLCWSFIRHTGVMTAVWAGSEKKNKTNRTGGRTGRYIGLYNAVVQGGFIGGSLLGAFVYDSSGFSNTFMIMAIISLTAVVSGAAGLRLSDADRFPIHRRTRSIDLRATLFLYLRGLLVALVGTGLIISTLGYVLKSRVGDTLSLGGVVIGIATVNGILLAARYTIVGLGAPIFGILIDKIGPTRVQFIGCILAGTAMLIGAVGGSMPLILILSVLVFFIGVTAARLALQTQAGVAGPRAYSSLATSMDFGAAIGPFLGWLGVEISRSGNVFPAAAGLLLLAALTLIPEMKRDD